MAAAAYQWFSQAPYMIDFPIAPVLGGFVISERTWQRIPERYHQAFKAAIADLARDFYLESDRLNSEAMNVMNRYGLDVRELTEDQTGDWFNVTTGGHSLVVGDGKWIDQEVYEEFILYLEQMR